VEYAPNTNVCSFNSFLLLELRETENASAKKGTRSATRRLRAISGRERRLKADANHVVSQRIVTRYPNSLIGLEQLTDIRERTKRRTQRRQKDGKGVERVSVKQRKANAVYSRWSFAEMQSMIAYKALLRGSMAIKVDAHHTSQACPVCGHRAPANRPNKGLLFVCQNCHYTLHADLVGGRNLAMRTLAARQDWAVTSVLSERPDGSSAQTKAARRLRYAELRWSLDTSPASLYRGI
jgi:IS605 OrfB family transposase